jgi:general secretion pathway protein A
MYTTYFGFNEKPFTLTPNPRFMYLSNNHKEAFAHLLYGINNHYGFIELVGEVGTGKTTILRSLLGQLQDENYRCALIFNPCLTGVELLRNINSEFGLVASSEYSNELLTELNRFLLKETEEGRTVVLVIDEAQNLQPEVLEQVRLISNLETENDKLIQIILAGQPELEALLERPDLRQLNQRIAVRYKLMPMSRDETRAYIRHRMEVAGETGGVSFSKTALKLIYLYSRGVPRLVNILCDRSLVIAYGNEKRLVTSAIVTQGIREILHFPQERRLFRMLAISTLMVAVVICIALFSWNIQRPVQFTDTSTDVATSATSSTGRKKQAPPENMVKDILSADQNQTHIHAFNAIAERWGVQPAMDNGDLLDVPDMFSKLVVKRNLRITTFKGALDQMIAFDLPFVIVTNVKGYMGGYCFSVTAASNSSLSMFPSLNGSSTISASELESISSGTYYLVWSNSAKIPDMLKRNDKSSEVKALQRLLQRAGCYRGVVDGIYSTATIKAVSDYQISTGLPVNSTLGEQTLATLTRFDNTRAIPLLKRK